MKILDATVRWNEKYSLNDPELAILVDKVPDWEQMTFSQRGSLYFAEQAGYVKFYSWTGGQQEGYGGDHRTIRLQTKGQVVRRVLRGPWSSRAGVMNQAGFTPSIDCLLTTDPNVLKRGWTYSHASITYQMGKKAAIMAGCYLVREARGGDKIWLPSTDDCIVIKQQMG